MANLFVGYSRESLTPPLGVDLAGYGFYLNRKASRVHDDLYVRTILFRSGDTTIALISCDLIGFTVEQSDTIRQNVAKECGSSMDHVLLSCTHTHTGPATMPMEGLGNIDSSYFSMIPDRILHSVRAAKEDLEQSELSYGIGIVEPIGYNRRNQTFDPIDSSLSVMHVHRNTCDIYLLGYGCHAVVLGSVSMVSADWPGAVVKAFEDSGSRALVFQGFCGDINPVTTLNPGWGGGDQEDLALYGKILFHRTLKILGQSRREKTITLHAKEKRISLPLTSVTEEMVEETKNRWISTYHDNPGIIRFIKGWSLAAHQALRSGSTSPCVENVPIQAIAIAGYKIIGLPGEVFSSYGPALRKKEPMLATFGFANGNIGYLPRKSDYQRKEDYACYQAPKFYNFLFPFTAEVEEILMTASEEVLALL
ncbi:MAG: neutral/alkaline non-lysosomal ceramidase N-terminal domain-containing protein [Candidatus Ratteibacteria bacterium]|jgi:neutral ceramidase